MKKIFVCHPSGILTDHIANGDGLIAHGFLTRLANRGYELHVAADKVEIQSPLPPTLHLYPLGVKSTNRALRMAEYTVRMRLLFERLRRTHNFGLTLQMNPVYPGISLGLLGSGLPLILGTYVPRWGDTFSGSKDSYTAAVGVAAKVRDLAVGLQQSHADALLLTTPAASNRVPWLPIDSSKINYVPHGIDVDLFHPSDANATATGQKILYLASVTARKGFFDLLKAFEQVAASAPAATLTIVGPGSEAEQVQQALAANPYRDRISVIGRVSREQTATIYREHDLLCLPSYGEPYATCLLEAMATGLPIVSTNTGGTPYLVPSEGGILVAPGDVPALASALTRIIGSVELQQAMAKVNRQASLETYAWDRVIDRLEGVYFDVSQGGIGRNASPSTDRALSFYEA